MSRKPAKAQHGSTTKPKRNNAPTEARPASSTLADLQEQVSALTRELAEAREQQTVTSEVLRVISSSPGELAPVFEAMLANAVRLFDAKFGDACYCAMGTRSQRDGGAQLHRPATCCRITKRDPSVLIRGVRPLAERSPTPSKPVHVARSRWTGSIHA